MNVITIPAKPQKGNAAAKEECKCELWVVFYLQSNKIAFEYQSVIF